MVAAPAAIVRDLSITYKGRGGGFKAVDNVSLRVDRGEIVGLVGESGSGKSTLGLAMLGLLPQEQAQVEGEIIIGDLNVVTASSRQLREIRGRGVSMVFQNVMTALDPVWSIGWQLEQSLRRERGESSRARRARIIEMLSLVGLPRPEELLGRFPHELSGGMRQRVVLAMGLMNGPDLIVADEPTTALDVTVQAQVLDTMREAVAAQNASVLFITHDLGVVANMCDRVVVMRHGKFVEEAGVVDLFERPEHPYTRDLLDSVPTF